jgi:alkylhydroperoxidase family enzyme
MLNALFTGKGETPPALRAAVAAAAGAPGSPGAAGDVPEPLQAFTEKVSRHAYKVTDADIAALKDAGYSEDAIFELTLAAAFGAGLARFDAALALLGGD